MMPSHAIPGVQTQSRAWRALAVTAALALVVTACGSVAPTPSPGETTAPTGSQPSQTQAPGATGQPGPIGSPGTGEVAPPPALPLPTLSEPFAVGEALYDPTRMDVAVVSLLHLMGVGVYAREGTPIRKGAEHAAGDPWLYDTEVRGLIDVGVEDLLSGAEDGAPWALSDLYDSVSGQLAQRVSLDEFVAAYRDAYAEHPEDLVPQVLLGQPIEAGMPLTRVQLWLLFMDGFVGPAGAVAGHVPPGTRLAQAPGGPTWGLAQPGLPQIPAPPGMDPGDWQELLVHIPTLADSIRFWTMMPGPHEGHGRTGDPETGTALINRELPLVSIVTGHTLLATTTGSLAGIDVTWRSVDEAVLRAHGSLSSALPARMTTDAAGQVRITYTPKKEDANGRGVVADDVASLYAAADRQALVNAIYVMPNVASALLAAGWLSGTRVADGDSFTIAWHTRGIEVEIINDYDLTIGNELTGSRAHREGTDTFKGVLTARDDGTWRGTLHGLILGPRGPGKADAPYTPDPPDPAGRLDEGTLLLPVVAADCRAQYHGGQSLSVVGRLQPSYVSTEFVITGTFGSEDLVLSFYPASAPFGDSATCSGERYEPYLGPPYVGPGPRGQPISGTYASWNDARFTSPIPGFRIHVPPKDDTHELWYLDRYVDDFPVVSYFYVTVKRSE